MSKVLVSLRSLANWFEVQKRVLPWRDHPSVYRVWVSEIMLQQTQVVTVVPYFERFIRRFGSVEELASAEEEEVLRYWAGLGYYSRARNLRKGALKIVQDRRFPENRDEWLEIPGVGNYTAGAILSIALDQPEAILDGNVERVLSRLVRAKRSSRHKGDTYFKSKLWKISKILVETGNRNEIKPSILNQALMELGATLCTPKKPKCEFCPLQKRCRAFQFGDPEAFPPKKQPRKWIVVEEMLYCTLDLKGKVLLRKRQTGEWREGLWDFPENPPQHAQFRPLGNVETRHVVTHHKIRRTTQVSQWTAAEPALPEIENSELRWISMADPEVAVGSALKKTLKLVQEKFEQRIESRSHF